MSLIAKNIFTNVVDFFNKLAEPISCHIMVQVENTHVSLFDISHKLRKDWR